MSRTITTKLVYEVNEHKVDDIRSIILPVVIILPVAMHIHYTSLDANYASRFAKTNYRLK